MIEWTREKEESWKELSDEREAYLLKKDATINSLNEIIDKLCENIPSRITIDTETLTEEFQLGLYDKNTTKMAVGKRITVTYFI